MALSISDKKQIRALDGAITRQLQAVYVDSSGTVQAAYAGENTATKHRGYGLVTSAATQKTDGTFSVGDMLGVTVFGPVGGFAGGTEGREFYVSPSTAGALTETKPTGAGQQVMSMGRIEKETIVMVMPQSTAPVSGA
jgi:hypothetical protein